MIDCGIEMAYRHSVCTQATLLARRFSHRFGYISHDNYRSKNNADLGAMSRRCINDFLKPNEVF